jgi:hypothetical protein
MLVFTPVYNFAIFMPLTGSRSPFSHAFFGAYRHALTVGFIMMMIVGVSSKVVPMLAGVDLRRTRSLWLTFILLNIGNITRVSFQIATDFSPVAYKVMGISGFIEVLGLSLWGYELIANMRAGKKLEKEGWPQVFAEALEISPQTKVGDVLERYPATLEIFLRHGFTPLSNPLLRKTLARAITIEQACRREDIDITNLIMELKAVAGGAQAIATPPVTITRINQAQPI